MAGSKLGDIAVIDFRKKMQPILHLFGNDLHSLERLEELLSSAINDEPVGSQVICCPPPKNSDIDILVLVQYAGQISESKAAKALPNWERGTFASFYEETIFTSSRLFIGGFDINLIEMTNPEDYNKFLLATTVAKRFNLLKKEDRIVLFQAILYGQHYPCSK